MRSIRAAWTLRPVVVKDFEGGPEPPCLIVMPPADSEAFLLSFPEVVAKAAVHDCDGDVTVLESWLNEGGADSVDCVVSTALGR